MGPNTTISRKTSRAKNTSKIVKKSFQEVKTDFSWPKSKLRPNREKKILSKKGKHSSISEQCTTYAPNNLLAQASPSTQWAIRNMHIQAPHALSELCTIWAPDKLHVTNILDKLCATCAPGKQYAY